MTQLMTPLDLLLLTSETWLVADNQLNFNFALFFNQICGQLRDETGAGT
jgi:hypothetical protein